MRTYHEDEDCASKCNHCECNGVPQDESGSILGPVDETTQDTGAVSDRELHACSRCSLSVPGGVIWQPGEGKTDNDVETGGDHEAAEVVRSS